MLYYRIIFNLFVPSAPFLDLLKTSENCKAIVTTKFSVDTAFLYHKSRAYFSIKVWKLSIHDIWILTQIWNKDGLIDADILEC